MKFTCPACHKVHRVKISITTPGEDPAPPPPPPASATRTMTRSQPQLPKKYATGAYPPVVDIPIDANFVLLDGREPRQGQGVDLGAAAVTPASAPPPPPPAPPPPASPPPEMDRDLSSRQTEIIGERTDEERSAPPPPANEPELAPETSDNFGSGADVSSASGEPTPAAPAEEDPGALTPPPPPADGTETPAEFVTEQPQPTRSEPKPAADEMWNGERASSPPPFPAPPPPASESGTASHSSRGSRTSTSFGASASRRRKKPERSSAVPLVLAALLLLGGSGFFFWQQYLSDKDRMRAKASLDLADAAWQRADAAAAARHAREAEAALEQSGSHYSAMNLYKRAVDWSGWFEPTAPEDDESRKLIEAHLIRERSLAAFKRELDPSDSSQMVGLLRETAPAAQGGILAAAMQRAIVDESLAHLNGRAESDAPEELAARAETDRNVITPELDPELAREYEERLDDFVAVQRHRMNDQLRDEVASIAGAAEAGESDALERYRALEQRLARLQPPEPPETLVDQADEADRAAIDQLARLSEIVSRARQSALTVLSRSEGDEMELNSLQRSADEDASPNRAMAAAAVAMIDELRAVSDDLLRLRGEVYGRVQSEMRRGRSYPGTRMAWSMLRTAFDDPEIAIDPERFRFDSTKARMEFTVHGVPAVMEMSEEDYEKRIRATIDGYSFETGWAYLIHKPLMWMATLAEAMREAGVSAERYPRWELLEGPGGPLALGIPASSSGTALGSAAAPEGRQLFFDGRLFPVTELPQPADARKVADDFRQAAMRLHDSVMADDSIPNTLRQALKPVLMGTYQQPDPRDYFDSSFCRRLIEADYLETYIKPMSGVIQSDLESYREVLGRLEAGYDEFMVDLGEGGKLVAVARLDADFGGEGKSSDQDPETGESLPRYVWRIEEDDNTAFYSPMPSRFVYAFMLAEHYPGRHAIRPVGVPERTEVWHTGKGFIASYQSGADKAVGNEELWNAAIAEDMSGRFDPTTGVPGWNFPLHVLERDDQGDPVVLATLSGIVKSPDFTGMREEESRRRAEDAWLDSTAATLSTPGELGLIFHQFFRYCSDSPLPEMPNLIGSHYGLSDTHQTVYESLERRWVGRLIGDCDDLAEFFQVLTRRQGKLSHVMQLPGHAACGYVETNDEGQYRFIVLQTGPVMQFVAPTLNDAVEIAYRSFDRGDGISHMTTDAVPLLLRFADEETRTPFVLSARIYGDAEYAETMIQVQSYWHEHVYSAALRTMEDLVKEDQEIGNIKELGSLYERVGFYDKSAEMRYRELDMVKDQPQAAISTLLEIVQLHLQEKNKEKALEALGMMEERMNEMIRNDDAPEFFRAMTFRSYWAMSLSRLGEPARAWNLIKYDTTMTKRQLGRIAEPVLRTMVVMYDRMCMQRDDPAHEATDAEKRAIAEVRRELDEAFGRGYFKSDDSYNTIIGRYFVLGRYAVSDAGRLSGLARVREDGPYPTEPKDQTRRSRGLSDEDWSWFRITPQLYLALAMEMLDQEEYPELYDPEAAKPILLDVARAVEKGAGLGSDVAGGDDVIKADLALSFIDRDLEAFRRIMTVVKEKDYASIYDDAALTFGLHGGLIPLAEFPAWIEAFHEFFPGSQHYFKVVYRAIDKENYDHALLMAEATARFFPESELLRREAEFVRSIIPGLKQRKLEREAAARRDATLAAELQPAA